MNQITAQANQQINGEIQQVGADNDASTQSAISGYWSNVSDQTGDAIDQQLNDEVSQTLAASARVPAIFESTAASAGSASSQMSAPLSPSTLKLGTLSGNQEHWYQASPSATSPADVSLGSLAENFVSATGSAIVNTFKQPILQAYDLGQVVVGIGYNMFNSDTYEPTFASDLGEGVQGGNFSTADQAKAAFGALPVAGQAIWGWNTGTDISNGDWNGVARDAGGLFGGLIGGKMMEGGFTLAAPGTPANVPNTTAPSVEDYVAGLYTKATPTSTNAGLFEVEQTGPLNYRVTGGGTAIDADGYQDTTLLDAKYVGNPANSPYVDGSSVPKFLQDKIDLQQQYEFQRYQAVIADPSVPFNSLNVLTNEPAAVPYFQRLMNQYQIPGEVQVVPTNIPQTVSPKP